MPAKAAVMAKREVTILNSILNDELDWVLDVVYVFLLDERLGMLVL
jgi:hypothetical protein